MTPHMYGIVCFREEEKPATVLLGEVGDVSRFGADICSYLSLGRSVGGR